MEVVAVADSVMVVDGARSTRRVAGDGRMTIGERMRGAVDGNGGVGEGGEEGEGGGAGELLMVAR